MIVNDSLLTSDPSIYAIGEVALHRGMIYGLVAPGYEMAEVLAASLVGDTREFRGADLSTKLKLMGVDVASFGQYEADADVARSVTFEDPIAGIYKKLLVTSDGKHLLGGMLVGDAADFTKLLSQCRSGKPLAGSPSDLLGMGKSSEAAGSRISTTTARSVPATTSPRERSATRSAAVSARSENSKSARKPAPVAAVACRSSPTSSMPN